MKLDKVTLVKALGLVMTIGGTIAASWAGEKNNEKTLEKLVDSRLEQK